MGIPLRSRVKKIFVKTLIFVFVITYIFIMLLIVEKYFQDPIFLKKTDVVSFLTGAKIIKEGEIKNLYNTSFQLKYQNEIVNTENRTFLLPFRNFPITAALFIPLLNLNLRNSFILVFCINILLLLIFHLLFIRAFPYVPKSNYLLILTIFIYPSISNLLAGQYTSAILLIIGIIYIFTKKEESFMSGVFSSLLTIKPQYLLFAPFMLISSKNKKRFTAGFAVGIFIFILINLAIARNFQVFTDYPKFIFATENSDFGSRPYQLFTFYGMVKQVLPNINSKTVIFTDLLIYVFVIYFIIKNRTNKKIDEIFIIGVISTLFLSVHALAHDLLVLLIPIHIFYLAKSDKHLLYSGLIFIAIGVLSLAQTSIITTTLIIIILFSRLYISGRAPSL